MDHENSLSALRSRVSALVEQEAALLEQAMELSREGSDHQGVDELFARVQAIQVERNSLKRQLGNVLGTHRMHVASEVWRLGVYDYREEPDAPPVRAHVSRGPLGLQVLLPGRPGPVSIDRLRGSFDGPLAVDDGHATPASPPRRRKSTKAAS